MDFFQGTKKSPIVEEEEDDDRSEGRILQTDEESTFSASTLRMPPNSKFRVGNGQLKLGEQDSGGYVSGLSETRNVSEESSSVSQFRGTFVAPSGSDEGGSVERENQERCVLSPPESERIEEKVEVSLILYFYRCLWFADLALVY